MKELECGVVEDFSVAVKVEAAELGKLATLQHELRRASLTLETLKFNADEFLIEMAKKYKIDPSKQLMADGTIKRE